MQRLASRKPRRRKVSPRLVTLSSSVILAAYGAGWMQTRAFRDSAQPASEPPTFAVTLPGADARLQRDTLSADRSQTPASTPTAALANPAATPEVVYREGRYVGSGESIHGGVTVAIVIFEGRIASAEIVKCDTRYACSEIDALSVQAVERQSARLRYVSGATDSSRAYVRALEAALARASG